MLDSERSDGVYRNQKKTHVIGLALARPSARFAHDGAWLHAGSLDIVLHFEKIKKAALSSAIAEAVLDLQHMHAHTHVHVTCACVRTICTCTCTCT
jgi:hypothetical protein